MGWQRLDFLDLKGKIFEPDYNKKETTKYRKAQLKWMPDDLYNATLKEIQEKDGS